MSQHTWVTLLKMFCVNVCNQVWGAGKVRRARSAQNLGKVSGPCELPGSSTHPPGLMGDTVRDPERGALRQEVCGAGPVGVPIISGDRGRGVAVCVWTAQGVETQTCRGTSVSV